MPVFFPFQFGAFNRLHVRRERIQIGLKKPVVLFYASDLHLGWPWSNPAARQVADAARKANPDAIILGGDLADTASALALLHRLVGEIKAIAPVYAIEGNHDLRLGVEPVREAVTAAGGVWLADLGGSSIIGGDVHLTSQITTRNEGAKLTVLCAHDPAIFPKAAAAGHRLVLAGHLHGGQCVLKTHNARLYPGAFFARWTGLRFTDGDCTMLVSRGAADTFPFRWNCPREVIVCEIV